MQRAGFDFFVCLWQLQEQKYTLGSVFLSIYWSVSEMRLKGLPGKLELEMFEWEYQSKMKTLRKGFEQVNE